MIFGPHYYLDSDCEFPLQSFLLSHQNLTALGETYSFNPTNRKFTFLAGLRVPSPLSIPAFSLYAASRFVSATIFLYLDLLPSVVTLYSLLTSYLFAINVTSYLQTLHPERCPRTAGTSL